MHIANPIYDVVFKFMMEDEKVAKSFLSAIIEEEVLELDFAAQERTLRRSLMNPAIMVEETEKLFLTVCRFDFSAKISVPDGSFKTVMIELQKAKMASDVMRFRRYLGLHYQNPNNTYGSEENKKACPIYGIFLLGYDIGISGRPIIHVNYNCEDGSTKQDFDTTNEFIQSLHHQSWIIQINQLKQSYQNNLEKLLSIFNQKNRTTNHHILNVNEDEFPEIYRPIIRRLRMASESEDIQNEMELEDDFMKELQDKERFIAKQSRVLAEKDKTLAEKDKTIKEKNETIEKDKKVIEEKDKVIEELKKQLAESRLKQF
jgi:hypothetical protein